MRKFAFSVLVFLFVCPVATAETAPSEEPTPPAAPPSVSTPAAGGAATEQGNSAATPKTPPANAPVLEPAPTNEANSPEIWSRPEPGQNRDNPPPYEVSRPRFFGRHYAPPDDPDSGDALKELGLTLGPPTIVNLNLGYWGPRSLPLLFRVSGMYYGDTRGIQADVGYIFQRDAHLKQYLAVTFVSWQTSVSWSSYWNGNTGNSSRDMFTGIGPSYGLNWNGLSVQLGVAFGQDVNVQNYGAGYSYGGNYLPPAVVTNSQFVPVGIFQIGYSFLW
jgi:hypothetical protein